jgi:hypothetical protein
MQWKRLEALGGQRVVYNGYVDGLQVAQIVRTFRDSKYRTRYGQPRTVREWEVLHGSKHANLRKAMEDAERVYERESALCVETS